MTVILPVVCLASSSFIAAKILAQLASPAQVQFTGWIQAKLHILILEIIVSKARIEQFKKARAASVNTYKRRRNAWQIVNNETYLQINDDDEDSKAGTTDI